MLKSELLTEINLSQNDLWPGKLHLTTACILHILRPENQQYPKTASKGILEGKRCRGRQHAQWIDQITSDTPNKGFTRATPNDPP